MVDQYEVYVNADATGEKFPYTVDGFIDALYAARDRRVFRLDVVHVVNNNKVDMDCPYGLTDNEIDIAHAMGLEHYV